MLVQTLILLFLSLTAFSNSFNYFVPIQRAIGFLEKHRNDLNLDALFGVQIARSQAFMLHRQFEHPSNTEYESIVESSEELIERSIFGIIKKDPEYYEKIGALLDPYHWSNIDCGKHLVGKNNNSSESFSSANLTESISDHCLSELFSSSSCKQSLFCKRTMMKQNYEDYGRAHCLLYLYIAFQKNCVTMKQLLKDSRELCRQMYQQNVQIERSHFPNLDQDIFMENMLFCGYLGFVEFLNNPVWNESILNWQSKECGCYQVPILTPKANGMTQKRRDKIVGNRCSLHKTSIAIGALAIVQTRRQLDQICPP